MLNSLKTNLKQIDEVSKLPMEYPGWMLQFTGGDRQRIIF